MGNQNSRRSLIGFHKDMGEYWFKNQTVFAEDFDLSQSKISDVVLDKSESHKNWIFSDPTEDDREIIDWWLGESQTYKHIANRDKILDKFFDDQKRKRKEDWGNS